MIKSKYFHCALSLIFRFIFSFSFLKTLISLASILFYILVLISHFRGEVVKLFNRKPEEPFPTRHANKKSQLLGPGRKAIPYFAALIYFTVNNRLTPFLLLLGILSGLSSCRTLKAPDFMGFENLRSTEFGVPESKIYLEMIFFNPNKVKLKLKKAAGDAYLNDSYLGHFRVDTLIRLLPKQNFIIPVTIEVDMKNVLKNSMAALLQSTVTLKFEGKAKLGKGFFYANYPIRHTGEFNIKDLLR